MEKNNFEISQELEQMREQFRILSDKVEKQNIVNDKLLASSINSKVNQYAYGKWGLVSALICALVTFANLDFCTKKGLPLWSIICVGAVGILFMVITILNMFKQKKELDFKGDVNEFSVKVRSMKRFHIITSIISRIAGYSMLIPFVYYYITAQSSPVRDSNLKSLLLFIVIWTVIAVVKELKRIRLLDDILKEIEE